MYEEALADIATRAEKSLGIGDVSDTVQCIGQVKKCSSRCNQELPNLAYINDRLRFYNRVILNYSEYPGMRSVVEILHLFIKKDNLNRDAVNKVNAVVLVLQRIEERVPGYSKRLDYRYLRLFVALIVHGDYVEAAVVAGFILEQLALSLGGG